MQFEQLYLRYRHRADFASIYIKEAHPSDGWGLLSNGRWARTNQPRVLSERLLAASTYLQSTLQASPLFVDSIENTLQIAYGAFPDRLFVLDRDEQGLPRVAMEGEVGPSGYKMEALEQYLRGKFSTDE